MSRCYAVKRIKAYERKVESLDTNINEILKEKEGATTGPDYERETVASEDIAINLDNAIRYLKEIYSHVEGIEQKTKEESQGEISIGYLVSIYTRRQANLLLRRITNLQSVYEFTKSGYESKKEIFDSILKARE